MMSDLVLQSWNPTDPGEARALVSAVIARAQSEGVELSTPPVVSWSSFFGQSDS